MDIPSHMYPMKKKIGYTGYDFANYSVDLDIGFLPEWVMEPELWKHLASRFKVKDVITVFALDGTFEADLRVMAIDPRGSWAQMRLKTDSPLGIISETIKHSPAPVVASTYPDKDGYTVEWGGPAHRFRIVDSAGIVAKDFPDKDTAVAALAAMKAAKPARAA